MKHRIGFNRLGRKPGHRRAMVRNMITSLLLHEHIRTTKAKALAIRSAVEKMVTRARLDSVHNRRMIARSIQDKAALAKLFTEIAPRYRRTTGGYTRILKLYVRRSDASKIVLLEFVEPVEVLSTVDTALESVEASAVTAEESHDDESL